MIPGKGMIRGKPNPRHQTLGERLRLAREAAGIKAGPLSTRAGLSVNTAFYIEEGRRVPGIDVVERLARILDVSPGWLGFAPLRAPMEPSPSAREGAALLCDSLVTRLKALRAERGLSQGALAEAVGVTRAGIGSIESTRTVPTVSTVEQIAKGLGVSPAWLAYGEGPQVLPKVPRQRKVKSAPKAERRGRPAKRGSSPARRQTASISRRTKGTR